MPKIANTIAIRGTLIRQNGPQTIRAKTRYPSNPARRKEEALSKKGVPDGLDEGEVVGSVVGFLEGLDETVGTVEATGAFVDVSKTNSNEGVAEGRADIEGINEGESECSAEGCADTEGIDEGETEGPAETEGETEGRGVLCIKVASDSFSFIIDDKKEDEDLAMYGRSNNITIITLIL